MSCRGVSCNQGRRACTDYICKLSDEAFDAEMNRRRADYFIGLVGVLALVLWAVKVIV